jgi:hypothetical protein
MVVLDGSLVYTFIRYYYTQRDEKLQMLLLLKYFKTIIKDTCVVFDCTRVIVFTSEQLALLLSYSNLSRRRLPTAAFGETILIETTEIKVSKRIN